MYRKLCGESTLQNVIFVTNMWKEESMAVNESREKEIREKFLKRAIDKGAKMVRHHNTQESAYNVIREIAKNHPAVLQIHQGIKETEQEKQQAEAEYHRRSDTPATSDAMK